ncbi:MAG TPA: hypothetical protein ENK46_12910 [Flavobacteriia bacterium]|nr:hypothetical protein [Flavobacteriia bacterium]
MNIPVLILLAGGKSSRMGTPKGLLDYHGIPWIVAQIFRYKNITNPTVYIGLGYDYEHYFEAVPQLKKAASQSYLWNGITIKAIINKHPENGAFSTLQAVLKEIDKEATVLVLPVDVPLLNDKGLQAIINCENIIVIPVCDGKNGHPVKLKPEFWRTLTTIDIKAKEARLDRQIKKQEPSSVSFLNVMENSVYQNINTMNDWNNYLLITKR